MKGTIHIHYGSKPYPYKICEGNAESTSTFSHHLLAVRSTKWSTKREIKRILKEREKESYKPYWWECETIEI